MYTINYLQDFIRYFTINDTIIPLLAVTVVFHNIILYSEFYCEINAAADVTQEITVKFEFELDSTALWD